MILRVSVPCARTVELVIGDGWSVMVGVEDGWWTGAPSTGGNETDRAQARDGVGAPRLP